MCYYELTHCGVSKKNWNTNEEQMEVHDVCTVCTVVGKKHEAMSNGEEINLSIVELSLAGGIS